MTRSRSAGGASQPMNKGQRRALLLLLIGSPGARGETREPIFGVTRLQKMLFILEKEYDAGKQLQGYEFKPWRFGPYSQELYDDLEFLENLGLIEASAFGEQTHEEESEEDLLDKQIYLTYLEEQEAVPYQGKAFRISERGRKKYAAILERLKAEGVDVERLGDAIKEVKATFNDMPLTKLIRYVYKRHPEYADLSELRHLA